jgi:thiosulfate reductase cytochrome b subunit
MYHRYAAWGLIALIVLTFFWHIAVGEWKQYIPTPKNMKAQIDYYLLGIFKNAPHPTKKTVLSKLNPLQKATYFFLMVIIIPGMIFTGLLYYYYRVPQAVTVNPLNVRELSDIALWHTIGAYFLVIFVIGHLYLITTGHTVLTNLKAMITGWEEIEEDDEEEKEHKEENQN